MSFETIHTKTLESLIKKSVLIFKLVLASLMLSFYFILDSFCLEIIPLWYLRAYMSLL